MHDFCFTPLYSALLLVGGLTAFFTKGSVASFVAGTTAAVIAGGAAYVSMQVYLKKHSKCVPTVVVSLVVAAGVAGKMGSAFLASPQTHVLQGVLAAASGIMVLYYLWNLLLFRPAKPAKRAQ